MASGSKGAGTIPARPRLTAYDAAMNEQAGPWHRHSRQVVYDNPWIRVFHDEVTRPDGQPGIYGVVHFHSLATGVVPHDTAADRVLLVGQYRYALDCYSWEIPEGGGSFEEEPEQAARRELSEETGYSGGTWRELCRIHLSNSVCDEAGVLFVAADPVPGPAAPEGTESLELRWVSFDEALAMIGRGEITDAMTIIALQQLALERARS